MRSHSLGTAVRWLALALLSGAAAGQSMFASGFERDEGGVCSNAYAAGFTPVTGQAIALSPSSPRPAKGASFSDPAFGTCVVRATSHASEPPVGFARNDYSRRQAFNADGTRFLAYARDGAWHLYDAQSLAHLRILDGLGGDAEPQWHPTDPRRLYYVETNGGMELLQIDVETNQSSVATSFAGKLPWGNVARVWTKSEGSPSADGRYWCFHAETSDFRIRGVFTYDLQTGTVLGTHPLSERPDHVSMSASGRWCVISGEEYPNTPNSNFNVVAWSRDFSQSRLLHGNSEHSDLALDANGQDAFVFVDYQSNEGDMVSVNLDTGARTTLFPTYLQGTATAYHVSGKNFAAPGWVLISTYNNYGPSEKWLHRRIFAVELAASPRILNIAHHHSEYCGSGDTPYFTEPHATVSRDFRRILFSSNWGGSPCDNIDAYMVVLPADFLP
ncbi:TolB family protein [Pseudomarimonas salicorniae]|uniref:WD40-like Beta Propeller Repeat n=1 Tax=Pseudomarimonas salicorniae TaxID=2933270 RepID=A0ABT0GHG8_9GAMM|nr:hypothetical protein [Lysobacter sp. CAU 1642]MCK7593980.1 hypothetical protein [Lysobacter sp. CAU 1642]